MRLAEGGAKHAALRDIRVLKRARDRRRGDLSLVSVTLTEGQNREIRRLFARVGIKVKSLERVALGALGARTPAARAVPRPARRGDPRAQALGPARGERVIANERKIAGWLLAVIVFLIAFGSLYPFSFSLAGAGPLERLGELPNAGTTRSDVAANVLLYLPLGTCLAWLLAARHGSTLAVLGATLIAAGLSFGIEFAQLYETRRVASLADFACNTAGASWAAGWRSRSRALGDGCTSRISPGSCVTPSRQRFFSRGSAIASPLLRSCSIPPSGQRPWRRSPPAAGPRRATC